MKKFIIAAALLIAVLMATPSQAMNRSTGSGATGCFAGIGEQMAGQCGGRTPAVKTERHHHHSWRFHHFHYFHHFHHVHFRHVSHHSHSHHHHH